MVNWKHVSEQVEKASEQDLSFLRFLTRTHEDSEAAAKVVDEVEEMKKTLSAVSGEMNYILTCSKMCRSYRDRLCFLDDMSHCKL